MLPVPEHSGYYTAGHRYHMVNKSKGEASYTVLDVDAANEELAAKLEAIAGVRKVRVIKG